MLRFIGDTLVMHPSLVGVAQKVNKTKFIDDKNIFKRISLLLSAIVDFSVYFIAWTASGTFYAVMDKKECVSVAYGGSFCIRCASSSEVRVSRRCCCESASLSALCKKCTHVLTFDQLV